MTLNVRCNEEERRVLGDRIRAGLGRDAQIDADMLVERLGICPPRNTSGQFLQSALLGTPYGYVPPRDESIARIMHALHIASSPDLS